MKIDVNDQHDLILSEVYNGIGIRTEAGVFGICERDGGLEVTFKGELIFAKYPERTQEGFQCVNCGVPLEPEDAGHAKCYACREGR